MNRWLIRSLILHKYDRDEGEILPPNWKVQPAGRRSKFDKISMGNNRKKAPRNTSPKLKSSKWPSPGLWTSFWQGCSEHERKIETHINSIHIQEGYDCLTSAISDNNNILGAVKVSAPLPRGVTAPVSVSEQKIQIIILILKRGPCLAGANVGNITNIWPRGESVIPGLGRPAPVVERVQVFLKPQSFEATPNLFYFWV